MSNGNLPLGDVISALRSEIMEAMARGKGQAVQFAVGPIELELNLTAKAEGGPEGKISFNVLGVGAEIGGKGKISREQVQKVKITLTPSRLTPFGNVTGIHVYADELKPLTEPDIL